MSREVLSEKRESEKLTEVDVIVVILREGDKILVEHRRDDEKVDP